MPWVVGCAAVLGGAAGAVLPRVAYRLSVPWGAPPRAGCVRCERPFPPGRAGWVRVGRACDCAARPGVPAWVTVAATGLTAGVLSRAVIGGPVVATPLVIMAAVLGVLLAAIDLVCLRLPDPLVGALAVVVVVPLCIVGSAGQLGRAVLGAGLFGTAYLMMLILTGDGLGFGDVKLAAVLGFALGFAGWPAVLIGAIAPHLLNGPIAVLLLATRKAGRRTALPLGPALLAGALVAAAVTGPP
jgi:leader peptidase (prepilin peptidase)/N-methyltransferase